MTTSSANIRTESGLVVRTSNGRRRPVVVAGPVLASCPVCNWRDSAETIAAGHCARCASIARKAR